MSAAEVPFSCVPRSLCPACGYAPDRATTIGRQQVTPRPGNFTVCSACGAVLQFGVLLQLVRAEEADLAELRARMPEQAELLAKAQAFFGEVRQRLGPPDMREGSA